MSITKRIHGEGVTTYAFFGKGKTKSIHISVDHPFSRSDCRLINQDMDAFSKAYNLVGEITDETIDKYYNNCGL